ncbi:hypothetical protein BD779DRAFT_457511 [Infundibulicybe gibba]|nr:hypothetical protein BD779DRAFT_457511 [Infundibulicybe gibba]
MLIIDSKPTAKSHQTSSMALNFHTRNAGDACHVQRHSTRCAYACSRYLTIIAPNHHFRGVRVTAGNRYGLAKSAGIIAVRVSNNQGMPQDARFFVLIDIL